MVDKVAPGQIFLRVFRFSPVNIISPGSIRIYHRRMNNRPVSGLVQGNSLVPSAWTTAIPRLNEFLMHGINLGIRWGWVVSVTPRPRFTPGKGHTVPICTGGWVGPRASLDTGDRGKILCSCWGSNPNRPVVQPVVRHYTAWAIPAPTHLSILYNKQPWSIIVL
jgi:hypothetical protein